MIKNYFAGALFSAIVLSGFTGINAQTLYPFPSPGLVQVEIYHQDWTQMMVPIGWSVMHTRDSTIGAYTYAQLRHLPLSQAESPFYTWNDSGKVYWQGTSISATPYLGWLLYDFTLNIGDTFNLQNSIMLDGTYTVDQVYNVTMLNAQQRKYLRLVNSSDTLEWIDGIGDVRNGMFYYTDFEGGYHEFVCASDSMGPLYSAANSSFYCDPNDPVPASGPNTCDQFSYNVNIGGTSCWGCDGYVSVTNVTGGTPAYTYHWSNGATTSTASNLCQGPITVTIYDATGDSCSRTFVVGARVYTATITHDSTLCDGVDTVCVIPNWGGPAPYTWQWYPAGFNNMCFQATVNGTYTVIVTDANGCTAQVSVVVNNAEVPYVTSSVTAASCSSCCDGNVTLNVYSGTQPYQYSWMPMFPGAGAFCPGNYAYCVTDANGCMVCDTASVLGPMLVPESFRTSFEVTPNPASDNIVIHRTGSTAATLNIRDISGRIVQSSQVSGVICAVELTGLADGIYTVEVEGCVRKIVVEHAQF